MGLDLAAYRLLSDELATQCMATRRWGRIIHLAPTATQVGLNSAAEGSAQSKAAAVAALTELTRRQAMQWRAQGITVNAIFTSGALHLPTAMSAEEQDDLKGPALLFASEAGRQITGQWLAVGGGADFPAGG